MSVWLLAASALMYAYVATDMGLLRDRPGFGLMYFGYAIGAVGACWDALR